MLDPYGILGLTKSATQAEIKASYRRLVKIYHPDKNPNNPTAVEKFRLIQSAYDILTDPVKKAKYDNPFAYTGFQQTSTTQQKPNSKRTKTYTFTDEDLKRRQYYKEHYKHHHNKTKQAGNPQQEKKAYNEVRYILFSVPVAVALLFFIINIYTHEKHEQAAKPVLTEAPIIEDTVSNVPPIKTSDQPYNSWFGGPLIDRNTLQVVQVTNWSGFDAIVCIVNAENDHVVRNYFVANNYNILYESLPEGTYYIKAYLGKGFKYNIPIDNMEVTGAFTLNPQFQGYKDEPFKISLNLHDTIQQNIYYLKDSSDLHLIKEKDFFAF